MISSVGSGTVLNMTRNKVHAIRNALFTLETAIPKGDRSKATERERDLIAVACVALWDYNTKVVHRALRRLQDASDKYARVMDLLVA